MKKKYCRLIYGLLAFAILLFGICTFFLYDTNRTKKFKSIGKITAILNNENNVFWKDTWQGLREEALSQQLALSEYQIESSESIADYLEIAVLSGTDGIIFNPSTIHDEESRQLLRQAYEENIALISLDSLYEEVPTLGITVDNLSGSQKIADYILSHISNEKIILLTYEITYSSSLRTRLETIQTALEENGYQEEVILLTIPNGEVEKREYLKNYLTSFEENAFLVTVGPQQTVSAARTVFSLDDPNQFRVIGFGESQEAIELLKKDGIEALLIQDNKQMGSLAVKYMAERLSGSEWTQDGIFVENFLYTGSVIDSLES